MFQLDENFLVRLGLGDMPEEEKEAFLAYLYEELEMRVGTELSKNLTDAQLVHFEKLIDADRQEEALAWLDQHCPDYKGVVAEQIQKLEKEVAASRDRLLEPAD